MKHFISKNLMRADDLPKSGSLLVSVPDFRYQFFGCRIVCITIFTASNLQLVFLIGIECCRFLVSEIPVPFFGIYFWYLIPIFIHYR